jgi:hypothetical protein
VVDTLFESTRGGAFGAAVGLEFGALADLGVNLAGVEISEPVLRTARPPIPEERNGLNPVIVVKRR